MRLQDQVCTYEQAKRLKELGVAQESLFYVIRNDEGQPEVQTRKDWIAQIARESLELAVEEAGSPSQYSYSQEDLDEQAEQILNASLNYNGEDAPEGFYSAFTVAELGMMLPDGKDVNPNYAQAIIYKNVFGKFTCAYESNNGDEPSETLLDFDGDTEVEARAAMLIHLLENKLITPEQVNNSLTSAN